MSDPRPDPAEALLRHFAASHLPSPYREVSELCGKLARDMFERLPAGPEKTAGLRKLLEAKDCFVRAEIARYPQDYRVQE